MNAIDILCAQLTRDLFAIAKFLCQLASKSVICFRNIVSTSMDVILHEGLSFDLHVTLLLKQCSQRIYLLRLLRSQEMSSNHLNTIFHVIIVSRILYPLPAWGVFMSAAQPGRIDAFLKRAHKCGFSKELLTVNELLVESGKVMFKKMKSATHCLHIMLLPPNKKMDYNLRNSESYVLPSVPPVPINVLLLTGACSISIVLFL